MMAERLSLVNIGKMNFDKWHCHSRQGIAQSDAGMSVSGWIDDDEAGSVQLGSLHAVDQGTFMIALEAFELYACICGQIGQFSIDLCQSLCTINLRLACAKQVEVGAVNDENLLQDRVRI